MACVRSVSAKFRYRTAMDQAEHAPIDDTSVPIRITRRTRGEVKMFTASLQVSKYVAAAVKPSAQPCAAADRRASSILARWSGFAPELGNLRLHHAHPGCLASRAETALGAIWVAWSTNGRLRFVTTACAALIPSAGRRGIAERGRSGGSPMGGYSYCIAGKSGSLPRPPGVMSRTFQIGQIESTWRGSSSSSRGANISSVAHR